ncbi:sigma-E factor negative regulatory protein [Lysobacter sp. CFH 32150]|uniref:sigma-E factor negative regulatory protein n=1 Tax=Lysobacter sp. CFH 32150 TaxID=2927128 RepID=UPI001FA711B2|nr:sigma-E factor negative regulatory protein [Lysobacter sp. CFH 32150]MCI4567440.1 sigma-E factor negative regulatory protein [Lysobacter sp. CFH 32150]
MSEKIEQHHRQQLSALMDGELAPDQARFLLRRLQHDHELGECWERWQVVGDVLRGHDNAMLPAGFAARVSAAIVADRAQAPAAISARARWVRWGGGAALAASVAAAALFMAQQMPDTASPAGPSDQIVAASNLSVLFGGTAAPSTPVQSERNLLANANTDVAGETETRRRAAGPRARGQQRPRSVMRASQREATAIVVAEAAPPAAAAVSPFTDVTLPATRPWPRTVLPQYSASGALTTDFGSVGSTPVFPAFESSPSSPSTEQNAGPTSPDAGPQP